MQDDMNAHARNERLRFAIAERIREAVLDELDATGGFTEMEDTEIARLARIGMRYEALGRAGFIVTAKEDIQPVETAQEPDDDEDVLTKADMPDITEPPLSEALVGISFWLNYLEHHIGKRLADIENTQMGTIARLTKMQEETAKRLRAIEAALKPEEDSNAKR